MLAVLILLSQFLMMQAEWSEQQNESSLSGLTQLLTEIAFWFLISLFLLSTISVLLSYLTFQFGKKKFFSNILQAGSKDIKSGFLQGDIPFYLKPLLGKLQALVWYKDDTQKASFFNKLPIGKFLMKLPVVHIKVYNVARIDLLFLDMLRMYRLSGAVYSVGTFSKQPKQIRLESVYTHPKNHTDDTQNIQQILHHPGEWLQFKYFETGDDVRRILWKLYAKNKDLYVRHQEPYTTYSSKLKVLCFFDLDPEFSAQLSPELLQHLLNYYKNALYSLYKELNQQFKEVEFSVFNEKKAVNNEEVLDLLTESKWSDHTQHYEIPEKVFSITHSMAPKELLEILNEHRFQQFSLIPLLQDLNIKNIDYWWWKWLFRKQTGPHTSVEHELPAAKTLYQLKSLEKERLETAAFPIR